jgi:hypothetical protein
LVTYLDENFTHIRSQPIRFWHINTHPIKDLLVINTLIGTLVDSKLFSQYLAETLAYWNLKQLFSLGHIEHLSRCIGDGLVHAFHLSTNVNETSWLLWIEAILAFYHTTPNMRLQY